MSERLRHPPSTGTLGFSYTPYGGGLGAGVISGVYATSGPSDADRFNAVALGMQMADSVVTPLGNAFVLGASLVPPLMPLMALSQCIAAAPNCSVAGTALAVLPLGGEWKAIQALRPLSAMGHAAKHLEDFRKIDPSLSEEAVAKILTWVKETYPGVGQASGKVVHEGEVLIGGQKVTVRVVETSSGNIKTGFPVK